MPNKTPPCWIPTEEEQKQYDVRAKQLFINNIERILTSSSSIEVYWEVSLFDNFINQILYRFAPRLHLDPKRLMFVPFTEKTWKIQFTFYSEEEFDEEPYLVVEEEELFDFLKTSIKNLQL